MDATRHTVPRLKIAKNPERSLNAGLMSQDPTYHSDVRATTTNVDLDSISTAACIRAVWFLEWLVLLLLEGDAPNEVYLAYAFADKLDKEELCWRGPSSPH